MSEPRFGLCGFLRRVAVLPTISRRYFVAFISGADGGMIDAHDGNADRFSRTSLELCGLIYQVIFYSVDLFDHRLREDLHFHADFDSRDLSARYSESRIFDRDHSGNDFAKGSIAAPSYYAATLIARIHNALTVGDPGYQSRRLREHI